MQNYSGRFVQVTLCFPDIIIIIIINNYYYSSLYIFKADLLSWAL